MRMVNRHSLDKIIKNKTKTECGEGYALIDERAPEFGIPLLPYESVCHLVFTWNRTNRKKHKLVEGDFVSRQTKIIIDEEFATINIEQRQKKFNEILLQIIKKFESYNTT